MPRALVLVAPFLIWLFPRKREGERLMVVLQANKIGIAFGDRQILPQNTFMFLKC